MAENLCDAWEVEAERLGVKWSGDYWHLGELWIAAALAGIRAHRVVREATGR